jgi:hypothetical protein
MISQSESCRVGVVDGGVNPVSRGVGGRPRMPRTTAATVLALVFRLPGATPAENQREEHHGEHQREVGHPEKIDSADLPTNRHWPRLSL